MVKRREIMRNEETDSSSLPALQRLSSRIQSDERSRPIRWGCLIECIHFVSLSYLSYRWRMEDNETSSTEEVDEHEKMPFLVSLSFTPNHICQSKTVHSYVQHSALSQLFISVSDFLQTSFRSLVSHDTVRLSYSYGLVPFCSVDEPLSEDALNVCVDRLICDEISSRPAAEPGMICYMYPSNKESSISASRLARVRIYKRIEGSHSDFTYCMWIGFFGLTHAPSSP